MPKYVVGSDKIIKRKVKSWVEAEHDDRKELFKRNQEGVDLFKFKFYILNGPVAVRTCSLWAMDWKDAIRRFRVLCPDTTFMTEVEWDKNVHKGRKVLEAA